MPIDHCLFVFVQHPTECTDMSDLFLSVEELANYLAEEAREFCQLQSCLKECNSFSDGA